MLRSRDERRREPLGLTRSAQARRAREQLPEQRVDLDAGDVSSEAEVRPAAAEPPAARTGRKVAVVGSGPAG